MLFNSLEFLLFLPFVFVLYYLVSHKLRGVVLLLSSYYFYMSWNPIYIVLIMISTLTDFGAGLLLDKTQDEFKRKGILALSLLLNLGLLSYFKYGDFFIENWNRLSYFSTSDLFTVKSLDLILPVGISFYTFQTLSYTIDVYHRRIRAEQSLQRFALYVCFFPQLVAGPIERYSTLMPQFERPAQMRKENLSQGFRLILFGLFLKMVIGDNIGVLVDENYRQIASTSSIDLLITAFLYSFQIYCDFHGYSTIAIGVAKLFDIDLSDNFKSPYWSHSLTSFWRKWHITLTNWFRDYIYYPLGGNKGSRLKWIVAILTVFIVSGFWHGAQWTFVIWGLAHGLLTSLEKHLGLDKKSKSQLVNALRGILIFMVVSLLWIFFRSPDLLTAKLYFKSLLTNTHLEMNTYSVKLLVLVGCFLLLDVFTRKQRFSQWLNTKMFAIRWVIYFGFIFAIMSQSGTDVQPFIYFQF